MNEITTSKTFKADAPRHTVIDNDNYMYHHDDGVIYQKYKLVPMEVLEGGGILVDLQSTNSAAGRSILVDCKSTNSMLTNRLSRTKMLAPRSIEGGRSNPFRLGDKTPQSLRAVFLCLSFVHFVGLQIMMVLFGQSLGLVSPCRGILTPFNTVTNAVRSIRDGLTLFRQGITA